MSLGASRIVAHANLVDGRALEASASQDLGLDHRAGRLEIHLLEELAPYQFEASIGIAESHAEQEPIEQSSASAEQPTREWSGTAEPVGSDQIILIAPLHQACDLRGIVLAIGIQQQHELPSCLPQAGPHRGTVATVTCVMQGTDARDAERQIIRELSSAVVAAIIDQQDLVLRHGIVERIGGGLHERAQIGHLVVYRNDGGDAADRGTSTRLRSAHRWDRGAGRHMNTSTGPLPEH